MVQRNQNARQDARELAALRSRLLAWYMRHRRDLPWRRTRDPYAIWVSEIMLQQTRVAAVIDKYSRFLGRFPTVASLARADEQDVLALWSGLGYYRRARMMHKAAQTVVERHRGAMPTRSEELRDLPGIGSYTAAAIASIAHGECAAVVDGNVERVLCRLEGWDAVTGRAADVLKRRIEALAAQFVDPDNPGDWNQAMMELGATVCTPRNPRCLVCPIAHHCKTRGEHKTAPRPAMVNREIAHALAVRTRKAGSKTDAKISADHREVLLEQRPVDVTVMPGLWELPALRGAEFPEPELRMTVRHAIMQVNYVVRIRAVAEQDVNELTLRHGRRRWVPLEELSQIALTGLARKVLKRAQLLQDGVARAQ